MVTTSSMGGQLPREDSRALIFRRSLHMAWLSRRDTSTSSSASPYIDANDESKTGSDYRPETSNKHSDRSAEGRHLGSSGYSLARLAYIYLLEYAGRHRLHRDIARRELQPIIALWRRRDRPHHSRDHLHHFVPCPRRLAYDRFRHGQSEDINER